MKILVVLASVTVVYAKPEPVYDGYNYRVPTDRYGLPIPQDGVPPLLGRIPIAQDGVPPLLGRIPIAQDGVPPLLGRIPIAQDGIPPLLGRIPIDRDGIPPPLGRIPIPQDGFVPPQSRVHKHIYVHVPPPDPEEPTFKKPVFVAPPQKHYKIIFIKAPSPPTPTVPTIPLQPQNEEKTLVYVLVKKPEEPTGINIPTPAPTQPSKPEVYFIRYKTQKQEGRTPGGKYGPPKTDYGVPDGIVY